MFQLPAFKIMTELYTIVYNCIQLYSYNDSVNDSVNDSNSLDVIFFIRKF